MKNEKKTERVFVYRNLHYKDQVTYSIKNVATGRVVDHSSRVVLNDVTFKVSQAGRKRVLKEKRKNVHAGVQGTRGKRIKSVSFIKVTYNPYKYFSFIRTDTMEPVYSAQQVLINEKGVWAYGLD